MYTSSIQKSSPNIISTEYNVMLQIECVGGWFLLCYKGSLGAWMHWFCSMMASEYIDLVPSLNMVWQKTAHFSEQLRVWAMCVPPQIPAHTPIRASVAEELAWWRTFLRRKQAK